MSTQSEPPPTPESLAGSRDRYKARAEAAESRLAELEAAARAFLAELDDENVTPTGLTKVDAFADRLRSLLQPATPDSAKGDLDALQREIGSWGDATFPNSTQASILAHLRDEVSREVTVDCDPEELADAAMLVIQLCHKRHLSLDSLLREKLTKNKARKWRFDPARGFSVHIQEGETPEPKPCATCGGSGKVWFHTDDCVCSRHPTPQRCIASSGTCSYGCTVYEGSCPSCCRPGAAGGGK